MPFSLLLLLTVISFLVSKEICSCYAQQQNSLPVTVSSAVIRGRATEACPAQEEIDAQRNSTKEEIRDLLLQNVIPSLKPQCQCGGGGWTRIAYLNMTDPSQQCPSNWTLHETPVRGCGKTSTTSSDSAFFPSNGRTYSQVCGRVFAYQKGSPHAFLHALSGALIGLEGQYIAGISLTHGSAGSRKHIWSFVSTYNEHDSATYLDWKCSCTDNTYNWTYTTPSFVGNDYFCDSGNHGPAWSYSAYYPNNTLWDGEECGPTSTCCQFNTPPWFCKTLPQPTSDNLELRNSGQGSQEDSIVYLVDIYIK